MFSCFDCLCTLKIPFCVALITVKSKPLHVSIECAFLDYLLCCFVLTLFTIKFDHLMLRWCVHSQITFSCGFVLTLVTVIFDPFMFDCLCNLRLSLYSDWSQSNHVPIVCALLIDFFVLTLSQSNLILSRLDSVCTLRWLLMVALYSLDLIPSCFDFLLLRELFWVALYTHWSQSIMIPSCFDSLCTLRLLLVVALYSHWSQSNLMSLCLDWLWNLRVCLYDVSIVCALSGYSWLLLCTYTDHNRI